MEYSEKLEKLEEAKRILKSEFVGLDEIIDQLINSVTPWYVTPEVLTRPLIISLWGITGTGKTCVVRRLLEILDAQSTVFFDIEEESSKTNLASTIVETLALDSCKSVHSDETHRTAFVFDEFQHARTIDETGREISKPSTRQMWNLIDSGIIELEECYWEAYKVNSFLDGFKVIYKLIPDAAVDNLTVSDPAAVKTIIESLGFSWFPNRANEYYKTLKSGEEGDEEAENVFDYSYRQLREEGNDEKDDTEEKSPLRPLKVLPGSIHLAIMTLYSSGEGLEDLGSKMKELLDCKTIKELYLTISNVRRYAVGKIRLDFSQSIVFLIGNLDEAFCGAKNLSADLSADHFKKEIEMVTVSSIKEALKNRFRAEQIARFGNVILKYPAFSSEDYKMIIQRSITDLLYRFQTISGKTISVTSDIVDLIYYEGVFPSQGARPVFTTINSILTPLLSKVLIDFGEETDIVAGIVNPGEGYRRDTKTIFFRSDKRTKEYTINLVIGRNRNPKNNPDRYIIGVHEAGHAIVSSLLTGFVPETIMSTAEKGGRTFSSLLEYSEDYMGTHYKKRCKQSIMTLLGGYCAEREIYGSIDPDLISFGSGSDLERAYDLLSTAAYENGYYSPMKYSNPKVQAKNMDGTLVGIDSKDIESLIKRDMSEFIYTVSKIVRENRGLIKEMGYIVAETGSISEKEITELIKKHESIGLNTEYKITMDKVETARKALSIDTLRSILF